MERFESFTGPSLYHADQAFAFLGKLGYSVANREEIGPQGHFKSGWELLYRSARVEVRVLYADVQLDITFKCGQDSVDYFYLDQYAYDRRSGYHGNMFPLEKLPTAVERVAQDIEQHYLPLLEGDSGAWEQAVRTMRAPQTKTKLP